MISFKLTKIADSQRFISGISLQDIEESLLKGIKTRDNQSIISSYNNIIIHHYRLGSTPFVFKITTK